MNYSLFYCHNNYKVLLTHILQIITVFNAIVMGWNVKKIGNNKYLFSKKISEIKESDYNLSHFSDNIIKWNFIN